MWKLITFFLLMPMVFCGGCGIVSIMGTPGVEEIKIPAEYDLARQKDKKILILVNQPAWLNAQENIRYYLTNSINARITEKIGIISKNLVSYDQLAKFRRGQPNLMGGSAIEIGRALNVDMVLVVDVASYRLRKISETNYYGGELSAQVRLVDVDEGNKVWPQIEGAKTIRVGFDVEEKGREVAISRLSAACAHCITRYLYNCKKSKFKIPDDKSDSAWEKWGS